MSGQRLRLFFALWPAPVMATATHAFAQSLVQDSGARWVQPDNLHLTLQFLGSQDPGRLEAIMQAANRVRSAPFELLLDTCEVWKRAQIAYLAPECTPPELLNLVDSLERSLSVAGIESGRRQFRAHVTLVRKFSKPLTNQRKPFVSWSPDHFRLVKSETHGGGPVYTEMARWPLRAELT